MSKLEKQKENVSITHFINPHLFWYHKIDACNDEYRAIIEIERELAEYYNKHQAWTHVLRRPPINAMVAVKFLPWNKMIRGRVDHVAGFGKNVVGGEFILWAVDYGFPFQTKADQIYRLPEKFAIPVEYIHRGGLANILPADNFFMKNTMVKRIASRWDQRACDIVEKAINDSESIVFSKEYTINGQEWGELVIKTNLGVKFRVKDHLISLHLAADAGSNFHEECLKLKTIKILPWICNNGYSKFHTNRAYLYSGVVGISNNGTKCPALECDDIAKQKVEEWYERNQMTSAHETGSLDSTAENTMTEGSVIDSVSLRKYDQRKSDLIKIDELEENQHMQLAGILSKSRVEKYVNGKLSAPPLPDSVDFEMIVGNVRSNQTLETTDSEISAIKYVPMEETSVNTVDTLQSIIISNDKLSAPKPNKCFADQIRNVENGSETAEENKNVECQVSSEKSENIGSFAEYLIKIRNQYIEKTSKKKDCANVPASEIIEPKESDNFKFEMLTIDSKCVDRVESTDLNTTFHGLRMIPAGFDFMNLYDYKDEDHWHCKKSTINDRMPHNEIDLEDFANRIIN